MSGQKVNLSLIETFAAAIMISWGAWVLYFGSVSMQGPAYASLLGRFDAFEQPARAQGGAALGVGLLQLFAIRINGRGLWWTPTVRVATCAVGVIFAMHLVTGFWSVNRGSTAVPIYSSSAVIYGLLMLANVDRQARAIRHYAARRRR